MFATVLNKLRWSYRKNWPDVAGFLGGYYPAFVTAGDNACLVQEVPVFVFHRVEALGFAAQLRFLHENGYQTLVGDELLAIIQGQRPVPARAVVLTFDDGSASLYSVAYPLLRRFGFRAISFIIPGCIPEEAPKTQTYDDVLAGTAQPAALLAREQGEYPLCSWVEIAEMHKSGVIDFQAHSMYHHLVQVAPQVVDFIHPKFDFYYYGPIHVPVYYQNRLPDYRRKVEWGTPVLRAEPRMAGKPQYFDNPTVRAACVDFVRTNGGVAFFSRPDWRRRLNHFYRQQERQNTEDVGFETIQETYADILQDLRSCKAAIETRLAGKTVTHFCFPWFIGSGLAVEAAKEAGFRALYWGIRQDTKTNRPGGDPLRIVRLEDRYLYRLPGHGRKRLRDLLREKVNANLTPFRKQLAQTAGQDSSSAKEEWQ